MVGVTNCDCQWFCCCGGAVMVWCCVAVCSIFSRGGGCQTTCGGRGGVGVASITNLVAPLRTCMVQIGYDCWPRSHTGQILHCNTQTADLLAEEGRTTVAIFFTLVKIMSPNGVFSFARMTAHVGLTSFGESVRFKQ